MNKSPIQVKKVTSREELEKCLDVRRKVFIEEQNIPEELEVDIFEKDSVHFIATYSGSTVGTGRFRLKKNFIKFERIATLKEMRGRGVGTAMMLEMQRVALHDYPEYLPAMHAQVDSIPFYEKLGWHCVGKEFEEAAIPHLVMIYPPSDVEKLQALRDPKTPEPIRRYLETLV